MNARLPRRRIVAGTAALLALLACVLLGMHAPRQALLVYLAAYLFFLAPALGSIPMLMIHALTGGRWGLDLRPALLAATRVLPLLALLLLPILLGAAWLYPWAGPHTTSDPTLAQQRWYLNLPFFWLRAVVCMALWLWLAHGLRRRLLDPDRDGPPVAFACVGMIIYALTITVAAVDWVGSLVPQWHSSIFGLTIGTAQLLAATALAVMITGVNGDDAPSRLRDLGTLLMALVLAWGYLAFMDFLTAWIADLPSEVVWYLPRLKTGWRWLGAALVMLDLVVPFVILLSHRAKQHRTWVAGVASMLLLAQAGFALWVVLPGMWTPDIMLVWTLPLAWIGIGGLTWALFDLRLSHAQEHTAQRSGSTGHCAEAST